MHTKSSTYRGNSRAFSLVEVLAVVAILAIIATVTVLSIGNTSSAVRTAKLTADVQRLNQIVSVYLAEGGTLDGLASPQAVLDKLKTVRSGLDIRANVGVMTGRGVDVRMVARMTTGRETAGNQPRVVWDAKGQKFAISTSYGTKGVADFMLDDSLASATPVVEVRGQTKEVFNKQDGWVWKPGEYASAAALAPMDVAMNDTPIGFNPNAPPVAAGSTTVGGGPSTIDPSAPPSPALISTAPPSLSQTAPPPITVSPPQITASLAIDSLWPPDHSLVDVGLNVSALSEASGNTRVKVIVYSNEEDQANTFYVDAKETAVGGLRLRAEREGGGPGRVYLIVVSATDSTQTTSHKTFTVVVPASAPNGAGLDSVHALAAGAAQAYDQTGVPPPGYVRVGQGPARGSKQ